MNINSEEIKKAAYELGADLCGVASIERFKEAPKGFHPCDILQECKSVIVIACKFPGNSFCDSETYTITRNQMAEKLDEIALILSEKFISKGITAVFKKSMGPCRWDENNRYRDTMSLKHAGMLAGMGKIGKNTLLVNNIFGNMIWLSAVLISQGLEADPIADYEVCYSECKVCLESCPVKAIDGELKDQLLCYNNAYTYINEEEHILCWKCREVCPNCFGI